MTNTFSTKFLPGTGRWQAQPDGGVGLGWGIAWKVWSARRATPPSLRATSPFRRGIIVVIASEARQSSSNGGTGLPRFARNDGFVSILKSPHYVSWTAKEFKNALLSRRGAQRRR